MDFNSNSNTLEQSDKVHQDGSNGINYFFDCLYDDAINHPSCYSVLSSSLRDLGNLFTTRCNDYTIFVYNFAFKGYFSFCYHVLYHNESYKLELSDFKFGLTFL